MIDNAAGPIFAWHNISIGTLGIALLALPVLYLGTVIGIRIVKVMNEKTLRYAIVIMTAAAAIRLRPTVSRVPQQFFKPHNFMRLIAIPYILFPLSDFYNCVNVTTQEGRDNEVMEKRGYVS